jgi:hypothetical protein
MTFVRQVCFSLLLWSLALGCGITAPDARADDCADCEKKLSLLERRPCGPDSIKGPLRYLFFQGCAGADFRAACRQHDACYDTIGSCQIDCDREFLEALLAECHLSKFPAHARFRAYLSYWAVSVAGRPAWRSAQILAISKANGTYTAPAPVSREVQFTGIFSGFAKLPMFAK